MNILEQYGEKINGTFSFFDRMILKGHILQFYSPSGKKHFLSYNNVLLKDFSSYAQKITQQLCNNIQEYTATKNCSVIHLSSPKTSKEKTATEEMERNAVKEGLICTISAVELCSTLQPIANRETGKLELRNVNRKCKYYYLYFKDKVFGFMHVKIQTWFPFMVQVYINGREMMKNVFDENNITYTMYDNSFLSIDENEKAQQLADQFNSKKLCRMGRKLDPKFLGEIVSDYRKRPEGYRVNG